MNDTIRKYIDELFTDAPKTKKALELKEEVTQNTCEKYQDLIAEGYQEQDAYETVIHSIGDVSELFADLEDRGMCALSAADRKKKAVLTATAVGIYIFAGVVFLVCMVINEMYFFMDSEIGLLGLALTAFFCIPPTCMLVYAAHMYPDIAVGGDSFVETYKVKKHMRSRAKAVHTSINVIIWMTTITLYFIISFVTFYWEITWILFLIGGCIQAVAALIFSLQRESEPET